MCQRDSGHQSSRCHPVTDIEPLSCPTSQCGKTYVLPRRNTPSPLKPQCVALTGETWKARVLPGLFLRPVRAAWSRNITWKRGVAALSARENHSRPDLHSSPTSLSNLLCEPDLLTQPLWMPVCPSEMWRYPMEQSSSFLEEGRNSR